MRLKSSAFVLLLLAVVAAGCADRHVRIFTANIPVYQSVAEWRSSALTFESPKTLVNPGRIYVYGNLLIVNEYMRGVHIFDNSNPSNPVNLGFLPVIGNADIAVKSGILYLDSYTDILSFDISDPAHPRYLTRLEDAFQLDKLDGLAYLDGFDPAYPIGSVNFDEGVVVGWKIGEARDEGDQKEPMMLAMAPLGNFVGGTGHGRTGNLQTEGIAASTARFAIEGNYLYALNNWSLLIVDIRSGISEVNSIDMGFEGYPETVFPADGNLFVGTTTGMRIYSLANPTSPAFLSQYDHGNSCDPVVVQGDKAFVTLASGRNCPGDANVLDVVDISNLRAPRLLYTYQLTNPHGLGVDQNTLFLCDGPDGLKVYDKGDLSTIDQHMIDQFGGIIANDVIPMGNVLLMTSAAGIYQYDYSDLRNIHQLSLIPVGN